MSFSTVLVIAFAAGVVLVVGGGLMVYMGNLVRSAYEIKVQINTEVDERLTKMAEDLDKKSRWIKRDLLEEIEKIKVALQTDNARKIGELADPLLKRVEALELALQKAQADLTKAIDADRQALAGLDQRVRAIRTQQGRESKPDAPPAGDALDEAAAILAARAAANGAASAAPTDATAPPEAPTPATAPPPKPSTGTPVNEILPELG